jgi:SEC-C motif-containing protein
MVVAPLESANAVIDSECHGARKRLTNAKYCYVFRRSFRDNKRMPALDDSAGRCPCGTGLTLGECCGPFLAGAAKAPTAERLMRSRYTGYVTGAIDYLLTTWYPSTRPETLMLDPDVRWIGLEILGRTGGGMLDTEGTVEFRASYRSDTGRSHQHETSHFIREQKAWYYVDGVVDH